MDDEHELTPDEGHAEDVGDAANSEPVDDAGDGGLAGDAGDGGLADDAGDGGLAGDAGDGGLADDAGDGGMAADAADRRPADDAGEGELADDVGDIEEHEHDDDDEEEREEALETVTIEITGLSLFTHHGVSAAEREVGQRLMLDLRLEVGETDATVTDRIEDTVDYAEVCQLVALVAQQRSHKTLERLCSTIADRLLADYELEGVWVKATKPEPPIALPVDEVSVEVWREGEE
jgi:dihydroneopterin aldolase